MNRLRHGPRGGGPKFVRASALLNDWPGSGDCSASQEPVSRHRKRELPFRFGVYHHGGAIRYGDDRACLPVGMVARARPLSTVTTKGRHRSVATRRAATAPLRQPSATGESQLWLTLPNGVVHRRPSQGLRPGDARGGDGALT